MNAELPSVYSEAKVKARREHRCCECRRVIAPGETYHVFKGCWDGKWQGYTTCDECQNLRNDLYDVYDDGIVFGELGEYAQEAGVAFTYHNDKAAMDQH